MAKKKLFGSPRSDAAYAEVAKSGGGGDPFGDLFKTVAPKLIKAGARAVGGEPAAQAVGIAEKAIKGDVEGAVVDAAVGTAVSQMKPEDAAVAKDLAEVPAAAAEGDDVLPASEEAAPAAVPEAPSELETQRDKVAAAQAKRDELEEAYFQKYRGYGML